MISQLNFLANFKERLVLPAAVRPVRIIIFGFISFWSFELLADEALLFQWVFLTPGRVVSCAAFFSGPFFRPSRLLNFGDC